MAETGGRPSADPFALWKQMLDTQEEAWSGFFQQVMGTEAFAATMGRYLDNLMNVQGTVDKAIERQFRTLNLPSRADLSRLASEVADLRTAIQGLSAQVAELSERLDERAPAPRPSTTRSTGSAAGRGRRTPAKPKKENRNDSAKA